MDAESTGCPRCGCMMSRVVESRVGSIHNYPVRVRVRICRHCNKLFRTKEIADPAVSIPRRRPSQKKALELPQLPSTQEEQVREELDCDPPSSFVFPP